MMEHIFRNINDIRVFDMMTDFVIEDSKVEEVEDKGIVDIDEIMDMLEYNEYKRVEVEDSVDHLVRNEILGIKKVKVESKSGCKICKWTDKLKLPRMGEHITHKSEDVQIGDIHNYYMKNNQLTELLRCAAFGHVFMMSEKEGKEENDSNTKLD